MSENPEDKRGSGEQVPDTEPTAPHFRRRLFIFKAAAVLGGATAAVLGASRKALADTGFGHQDKGGGHDADKTGD
jgi:hypothetical protein